MAQVKHLLQRKGKAVWFVTPQTSTLDTLILLEKHDIGALLVMEGEQLVGIFSERDLARRLARTKAVDLQAPISDFMTKNVFFVEAANTVEECMKLMTTKHIRHLPVMESGKVVAVISINDLVKEIIADQESTIKSLENYIFGQSMSS